MVWETIPSQGIVLVVTAARHGHMQNAGARAFAHSSVTRLGGDADSP